MDAPDFTTTFLVEQTPEEAFAAITDVRGWWSGEIEGETTRVGDVFTYRYKDMHRSTQKVIEVVPGEKVVWQVLDAYLQFTEDKSEWNGTKVIFEISRQGDRTAIRFTHQGLVPAFECFDKCSSAWSFYLNDSLRSLIATGTGDPNRKETDPGREVARN